MKQNIKFLSLTDKFEDHVEYFWTACFSAFFYLCVFKYIEAYETNYITSFLIGLLTIYVFKSLTRLTINEISPRFNIFYEILLCSVAILIYQII